MRTCRKCCETKELTEFSRRAERPRAEGYSWQCKKCINEQRRQTRSKNKDHYRKKAAEWREKNRERFNELARNLRNKTKQEREKLYQKKLVELAKESDVLYEEKKKKWEDFNWDEYFIQSDVENKHKHNARVYLGKALRKGDVKRKDICEICEIDDSKEAHHYDYTKYLEVIWVCRTCHYELHRREKLKRISWK